MSEVTTNSALNQQTYHADSSDNLADRVHRTIGVLLPHALLTGSFDNKGELLIIHYTDYKQTLAGWIIDFFEHQFITDPLLTDINKPGTLFIATNKYLLVPGVLYNETEAENWFKKIDFIEASEVVSTRHLKEVDANYLYAWPAAIKKLLAKYFTHAQILPLASFQFAGNHATGYSLQCCITNEDVYATLYNNNTLLWHQVFDYKTTEDIAYKLKLLCKQYSIEPADIQYTSTGNQQTTIINELSRYFRGINNGADSADWSATISLLKQLYICAS